MKEATIHFAGEAFHSLKWVQLLRQMGFRLSGGRLEKAVYASRGNNLIAESRGFVTRDEQQGYEWQLTLKETRRWEGTIKFYSVLLGAFAMPHSAVVMCADHFFTDRRTLRAYAEAAITQEFSLDELIDHRVFQKGDGVQFV